MDLELVALALGVVLLAAGASLAWPPAGLMCLGAGFLGWSLLIGREG